MDNDPRCHYRIFSYLFLEVYYQTFPFNAWRIPQPVWLRQLAKIIKAIFRPLFSVWLRLLFVGLSLWFCLKFEADVAVRLEHQIRFKRPAALGDEVRYKIRLAVLK